MKLRIPVGLLFINEFSNIRDAFGFGVCRSKHINIFREARFSHRGAIPLYMSAVEEMKRETETDEIVTVGKHKFCVSKDGVFKIKDQKDHAALLAAHGDKLIILKLFAPWCRACKALAPKFIMIKKDEKLQNIPIIFAEMSAVGNKEFLKNLGVLALPSVQFYAGSEIVESFPCGPSKVSVLRKKLIIFINERIDAKERKVKSTIVQDKEDETKPEFTDIKINDVLDSELLNNIRYQVPYFKELNDKEFDELMSKATIQSFEPKSIIMRQGMPGTKFYYIESGECEVSAKNGLEDPLTTPPTYLGSVFNVLEKNSFFGERSLITGELRAATIRVVEKTRCIVFNQKDIPASSVLHGNQTPTKERLDEVNDKYQVDPTLVDKISDQLSTSSIANQQRGSINTPQKIQGVDTDEFVDVGIPQTENENLIIPLLIRFKRVRQAQKCFDYVTMEENKQQIFFDNIGQSTRRSMLVSRLPATTYEEFVEIWGLLDKNNDGTLTLFEMKKFMENIGEEKSTSTLQDIVAKSHPNIDSISSMSFSDFMGIMAEAEFYYLFIDTFKALDKQESGFVRIGDLNHILCGMMDLVCDSRTNIIKMDDEDMLIDYEQYSKMLLGANFL